MRTTSSGSTFPATVSTMLEGVERLVAGVEGIGGDVGDGLLGAGDGHPDGVVVKQALHQAVEHLVLRVVLHHADLLSDDALLLVHALLGEVGDGHKGQEDFQVIIELLRALEEIAGDGRAGEGVGEAPLAARSWRALPSSVSNILCSRKWATPAGVSCQASFSWKRMSMPP